MSVAQIWDLRHMDTIDLSCGRKPLAQSFGKYTRCTRIHVMVHVYLRSGGPAWCGYYYHFFWSRNRAAWCLLECWAATLFLKLVWAAGLQRAVVLVASQKTLPIAVTVLSQLSAFVKGPIGLAVIPCVVCHLGQILVDSLLVSSWMDKDGRLQAV